jgi:hypothetical protein
MTRLLLIFTLLLGGCAARWQYFQPTEHVHGTTLQGFKEAIYELHGPQGRFGEAKVWSRGAYRGPGGRTVIHLGIELHNTSGVTLELYAADVRLDRVRTAGGVLTEVAPAETGSYVAQPTAIVEARFHFVLPAGTSPGDVTAFRARWRVLSAGQSYQQYTPFAEQYRGYWVGPPYSYYRYYCDPFDPYCFYPGPYYYHPYGGYGYRQTIIVHPESRTIVHPRR